MNEQKSSKITPKSELYDFYQALMQYWGEIRDRVRSTLSESENDLEIMDDSSQWTLQLAKEYYPQTRDFYDHWKHIGNFTMLGGYELKYHSCELALKGWEILIPYNPIMWEKNSPKNTFLEEIKEMTTVEEIEQCIWKAYAWFTSEKEQIKESQLKILKELMNMSNQKWITQFPHALQLAGKLKMDPRTVSANLNQMLNTTLLSAIYQLDFGKIGYRSLAIVHEKLDQSEFDKIKPYESMQFYLSDRTCCSILHHPNKNHQKYQILKEKMKFNEELVLTKRKLGWNLQGLTSDKKDRWKLRPPFVQMSTYLKRKKEIIIGGQGMTFDLIPLTDPAILHSTEGRILDRIARVGITSTRSLALTLGISEKYIRRYLKRLRKEKIIRFFPILGAKEIGLEWIYFYFKFPLYSSEIDYQKYLVNHLSLFPYYNLYISHNSRVVVGTVLLHGNWMVGFSNHVSKIKEEQPSLEVHFSTQDLIHGSWGFDILNTYDWE